ncbi:uncharacterized protein G2W53_007599 [Senna tora]|uniref:Uncharacterized protein n=1 Tax=Senna tora TaxID=362788 RepID=A0A835CHE6_9FABA|nr:uncharacterized protein G2W53_007599 [Senna tora]
MGLVITWKKFEVMSKSILNQKSRFNLKIIQVQVKRVVAQVSETNYFVLYMGIQVDLLLERES